MRILAFDTATRATAVALVDLHAEPSFHLEARDDPADDARPGHTQTLLALIEEVLSQSDEGWAGVDRIAVGIGPGTFTGLRIGIATAHALARGTGIPLVGVSTLSSLALGARVAGPQAGVLSLIDARRGEVFAAAWRPRADPRHDPPSCAPQVLRPAQLPATVTELSSQPLVIGDGAVKFREILERAGARVPPDESALHRVSAGEHCQLASGMVPGAPDAVLPAYLRLPDAEIARQA